MSRHTKIGLMVAVVFSLISTPIGLFSANGSAWSSVGQLLTLPSLPVILVMVQFFPPLMGESQSSPWDYLVVAVAVTTSAVIWGLIAYTLSRFISSKPKDTA